MWSGWVRVWALCVLNTAVVVFVVVDIVIVYPPLSGLVEGGTI